MKSLKNIKWAALILAIAAIIIGILLIIFPQISLNVLCITVGILAIIAGMFRIVRYFMRDAYPMLFHAEFSMGMFELFAGILLIVLRNVITSVLPIFVGVYVVIESTFTMQTAMDGLRLKVRYAWLLLILSVSSVALGIAMIFAGSGTRLLGILLGASLAVTGVEQVWMTLSATRTIKHLRLGLYDTDWDVR